MAESIDIRELNARIEQESSFVVNLTTGMNQVIVGQKHLIDSLLISFISNGHVLLEGVPGLAKTLAIKTLSQLVEKMSVNPAKVIGIDKGNLAEGKKADIAIADISTEYKIDSSKFASKGHNTPFDGKKVTGKVLLTITDGKIVYRSENK